MRPYTFQEAVGLYQDTLTDGVTSVAEPADGAQSLEANAHEDFTVSVTIEQAADGAKSVSVDFYESDTNSGDVSTTWSKTKGPDGVSDADPLTATFSATSDLPQTALLTLNRLNVSKKYVSAIATLTHPDDNAVGTVSVVLFGEGAGRQ